MNEKKKKKKIMKQVPWFLGWFIKTCFRSNDLIKFIPSVKVLSVDSYKCECEFCSKTW